MIAELTKYHGVGDTPRSNDRRPIDPMSIRNISKDPLVAGVAVGDQVAPGGGSGHVIVTQWKLDDFENNEGFNQAIDEDFRAIREIYKTVLPYPLNTFKKYVVGTISIYCALLMIRQKLASYNQTHDTIPYLHEALVSVPSNVTEKGVVTAAKIKFLEDDDIAVTLANYTFMANRAKSLVIPGAVKRYLDWLFANQFIDSNLIAPQFYINEINGIPLYGNNNNQFEVVKIWDLRVGTIADVLNSIEDLLSLGSMINADLHKTGLMSVMDVPELKTSIIDKDYEYFNILINACEADAPVYYAPGNPFKEDYSRVDVIGSMDDSHIQAAAIGALRRWGHGLLVEIVSQGIFVPAILNTAVPFNFVVGDGNITPSAGMPTQNESFYIQLTGNYGNEMVTTRYAANATQYYIGTKSKRVPGWLTYNGLTLSSTGYYYFNFLLPSGGRVVLAESPTWQLVLHITSVSTGNLLLHDRVGNTDTTLSSLGAANCPFFINGAISYGNGAIMVEVRSNTNTFTSGTAAVIAALTTIFGPDGVFYNAFDLTCEFTYADTSVSYSAKISDPVILAIFVEQVDYHLPMNYDLAFRVREGGTDKVALGVGYLQLKESYTPLILNKYDCEAFLRFALLGMFTSGGQVSYARPRNEKAQRRDTSKYSKRKDKKRKDKDEGAKAKAQGVEMKTTNS